MASVRMSFAVPNSASGGSVAAVRNTLVWACTSSKHLEHLRKAGIDVRLFDDPALAEQFLSERVLAFSSSSSSNATMTTATTSSNHSNIPAPTIFCIVSDSIKVLEHFIRFVDVYESFGIQCIALETEQNHHTFHEKFRKSDKLIAKFFAASDLRNYVGENRFVTIGGHVQRCFLLEQARNMSSSSSNSSNIGRGGSGTSSHSAAAANNNPQSAVGASAASAAAGSASAVVPAATLPMPPPDLNIQNLQYITLTQHGTLWSGFDAVRRVRVAVRHFPPEKHDVLDTFERLQRVQDPSLCSPLDVSREHHWMSMAQYDFTVGSIFKARPAPLSYTMRVLQTIVRAVRAVHGQGCLFRSLGPMSAGIDSAHQVRVAVSHCVLKERATDHLDILLHHYTAPEGLFYYAHSLSSSSSSSGSPSSEPAAVGGDKKVAQVFTEASDMWCVGALLFNLLTGQRLMDDIKGDDLAGKYRQMQDEHHLVSAMPPPTTSTTATTKATGKLKSMGQQQSSSELLSQQQQQGQSAAISDSSNSICNESTTSTAANDFPVSSTKLLHLYGNTVSLDADTCPDILIRLVERLLSFDPSRRPTLQELEHFPLIQPDGLPPLNLRDGTFARRPVERGTWRFKYVEHKVAKAQLQCLESHLRFTVEQVTAVANPVMRELHEETRKRLEEVEQREGEGSSFFSNGTTANGSSGSGAGAGAGGASNSNNGSGNSFMQSSASLNSSTNGGDQRTLRQASSYIAPVTEEAIGFYGYRANETGLLDSILSYGILCASNPLNPRDMSKFQEKGTIGRNTRGVYLTKFPLKAAEYTASEQLEDNDVVEILLFSYVKGRSLSWTRGMSFQESYYEQYDSFISMDDDIYLLDDAKHKVMAYPEYIVKLRVSRPDHCSPLFAGGGGGGGVGAVGGGGINSNGFRPAKQRFFVTDKKLGEGGFSEVRLAIQLPEGRPVAAKIFKESVAVDAGQSKEEFIRACQQEFDVMKTFRHYRNVAQSIDFKIVGPQRDPVLFMELLSTSVHDLIEAFGPLEPMFAVSLLRQAAAGLSAMALEGRTHADVKPQNLMLDAAGTLKVTDFGLTISRGAAVIGATPFYVDPAIILPPTSPIFGRGAVSDSSGQTPTTSNPMGSHQPTAPASAPSSSSSGGGGGGGCGGDGGGDYDDDDGKRAPPRAPSVPSGSSSGTLTPQLGMGAPATSSGVGMGMPITTAYSFEESLLMPTSAGIGTHHSDCYALGLTFWRMLTAKPTIGPRRPLPGNAEYVELRQQYVMNNLPDLPKYPGIIDLLLRMIDIHPENRPRFNEILLFNPFVGSVPSAVLLSPIAATASTIALDSDEFDAGEDRDASASSLTSAQQNKTDDVVEDVVFSKVRPTAAPPTTAAAAIAIASAATSTVASTNDPQQQLELRLPAQQFLSGHDIDLGIAGHTQAFIYNILSQKAQHQQQHHTLGVGSREHSEAVAGGTDVSGPITSIEALAAALAGAGTGAGGLGRSLNGTTPSAASAASATSSSASSSSSASTPESGIISGAAGSSIAAGIMAALQQLGREKMLLQQQQQRHQHEVSSTFELSDEGDMSYCATLR